MPGVSAAVAAPGLAGIPVTHRGLSTAFVVVAGHVDAAFTPVLGSLEPGAATVVVLMGLTRRAALAALLLSRGWNTQTPAALLLSAGTVEARLLARHAAECLGRCDLPDLHPTLPGVLVIGATVAVADQLAGLEARQRPAVGTAPGCSGDGRPRASAPRTLTAQRRRAFWRLTSFTSFPVFSGTPLPSRNLGSHGQSATPP